eukprot:scaffold1152_cov30-Prasinocladus_malaysianus.AAC.1
MANRFKVDFNNRREISVHPASEQITIREKNQDWDARLLFHLFALPRQCRIKRKNNWCDEISVHPTQAG